MGNEIGSARTGGRRGRQAAAAPSREARLPNPAYVRLRNPYPPLAQLSAGVTAASSHRTNRSHSQLRLTEALNLVVLNPREIASGRLGAGRLFVMTAGMMSENTGAHDLALRMMGDPKQAVFFVGYADPDSPAGRLRAAKDGETFLFSASGGEAPRHCRVEEFDLTAHAQREDLLEFVGRVNPRTVVLGHGDAPARAWFAQQIQARWLAAKRHDAQPEEVFIAALLYRFGEMAFWCFAGAAGDELDEALRRDPQFPGDVEMSLLGFRLGQLTAALTRDWRVSPLLQSVLKGGYAKRSREQAVVLAFRLAEGSEGGWNTERARARLKDVAEFLQLPAEELAATLMKNAVEAAAIAECYGASEAARFIPQ